MQYCTSTNPIERGLFKMRQKEIWRSLIVPTGKLMDSVVRLGYDKEQPSIYKGVYEFDSHDRLTITNLNGERSYVSAKGDQITIGDDSMRVHIWEEDNGFPYKLSITNKSGIRESNIHNMDEGDDEIFYIDVSRSGPDVFEGYPDIYTIRVKTVDDMVLYDMYGEDGKFIENLLTYSLKQRRGMYENMYMID